ncbi:LYR motif containing protein 1 isoform X3 [Heterodontus francisci]|uniref:LYR motif containing protein 1 isoform X3 n=1 Tax=Heterodontus francisci TaxID=7792 RepID=UPI00355BA175
MTATRCDVLGLYRRIFRIARTWQSLSGLTDDTLKEKEYIITEARSLFRKNKNDYITEFLTRDQLIMESCSSRTIHKQGFSVLERWIKGKVQQERENPRTRRIPFLPQIQIQCGQ